MKMVNVLSLRDKYFNNLKSFCFFFVITFVLCALYPIVFSPIIPILAAIILLSSVLFFNVKYRLYLLLFFVPFTKFFNVVSLGVGSFYSYIILLYVIVTLMEKTMKKQINTRQLIIGGILCLYILVLSIVVSGLSGLVKAVSVCGYLLSILAFFNDEKADKNPTLLLVSFLGGFLASNILAVSIIYLMNDSIATRFIETYLSEQYLKSFLRGKGGFRFPGLVGDPNYLGFYTLTATAIFVSYFKNLRFKIFIGIFVLGLNAFCLLGSSKNYILVLALLIIGTLIVICMKYKRITPIVLCVLSLLLIVGNFYLPSGIINVIKRLFNFDDRTGFLNALTTGRLELQTLYMSELLSSPIHLLFGSGVGAPELINGAHNFYIMLIWDYGLIGGIIYLMYFSSFIPFKKMKNNLRLFLPLILIALFGFSLDYTMSNELLIFILFIYTTLNHQIINFNCAKKEIIRI